VRIGLIVVGAIRTHKRQDSPTDLSADPKILWVDDCPENNSYESNLFGRLGARINVARSTREAIQQLDHGKYDLLITDVHRVEEGVEEPTAGYALIAKTETREPYTPSIIYTSNIEGLDPIESAPASGVADDPRALADLVVRLIGKSAA
jgi:CheY-like chemotaxis protein